MGRNANYDISTGRGRENVWTGQYVAKTKIMTVGNWKTTGKIKVGSKEIDECHKFCILAAPSPTTEVVTGRFWYDWVKPTVHLDSWEEFGRAGRYPPV